ncbi:hypothetical protein HV263_23970 (plasmid) [Enterobacter cloacae]|jgi:hypothetical protein|uniref:MAE_28990/MAE_18760 family HEPN-like nuclease n=2 Tax=Enterobacter asburiae TaxID=61645 RepID=UPI0015EA764D|nr:hypothetical protein HV263_23970 [Enterobacter cloacae]
MSNDPKDDFQNFVQSDLGWRKREMSTIKGFVFSSTGLNQHTYVRAGIALLYSHWEGHIKQCSCEYINYLNKLGVKLSSLSENNITSYMYYKFSLLNGSKQITSYTDIYNSISNNLTAEVFNIPPKSIIRTESNLKVRRLEDILHVIGIDNSAFMACKTQIDSQLLHHRNGISHGERTDGLQSTTLSTASYSTLHDKIIELIGLFSDAIIDHVINDKYMKQTNP